VYTRYWGAGGPETPQEVYSVTKSLTSTLVGLAQADGDLSIDDPAATYVEAWRGTPSE
jgi:CubicO group peptidase (beta-lactamase class C family)